MSQFPSPPHSLSPPPLPLHPTLTSAASFRPLPLRQLSSDDRMKPRYIFENVDVAVHTLLSKYGM